MGISCSSPRGGACFWGSLQMLLREPATWHSLKGPHWAEDPGGFRASLRPLLGLLSFWGRREMSAALGKVQNRHQFCSLDYS